MDLFRYEPEDAQPLPGGANAFYTPLRREDRMVAMMLVLDKRGDTGKREITRNTLITVIAGEGNIRAGGAVAELSPGDVVMMPGGRDHQIWTSTTGLQVLIVNIP